MAPGPWSPYQAAQRGAGMTEAEQPLDRDHTGGGRPGVPITVPLLIAVAYWAWLLVLLAGGNRAAPPEGVAGTSERYDEVEEAVKSFRRDRRWASRMAFIKQFGKFPAPRVTLALMEEVVLMEAVILDEDPNLSLRMYASEAVFYHHIPPGERPDGAAKSWTMCWIWWQEAGPDVRRRAAALSR